MQKWLFSIFVKKALKRGVQVLVAYMMSLQLAKYGVSIEQEALTASIWAGIEALRQYVKVKTGVAWL